jgi:hypothetical protein
MVGRNCFAKLAKFSIVQFMLPAVYKDLSVVVVVGR